MNGFRIGFIAALSILIAMSVSAYTAAYVPPPTGPKAPKYPEYPSYPLQAGQYGVQQNPLSSILPKTAIPTQPVVAQRAQTQQQFDNSYLEREQKYQESLKKYDEDMKKYQEEKKKYDEDQKNFEKDKVIPYAQKVITGWIITFVALEVIAMFFIKIGADIVGSGYAFSAIWAFIIGPISWVGWYASILISRYAMQAELEYSYTPLYQSIAWSSIIGVVILTVLGTLLFSRFQLRFPRLPKLSLPPQPPVPQG